MYSGMIIWISIVAYLFCSLKSCYSLDCNGAKIVTYGEPCVKTCRLPFQIQGPKSCSKEEKAPVSLNFKVVTDMYTQPRHIEYPISVDMPTTTSSPSEKLSMEDTLRGEVYAYNTYVPPAGNPSLPSKNYNFQVENPITTDDVTSDDECETTVKRLKGLQSRIDRILVPACEVSSLSCS